MATKKTAVKTKKTPTESNAVLALEGYRRYKAKHPFLRDRGAEGVWLVLRLDLYNTSPAALGQYYPSGTDEVDLPSQKALWSSEELAVRAARWAAREFNNTYGVFRLSHIVHREEAPLKETRV